MNLSTKAVGSVTNLFISTEDSSTRIEVPSVGLDKYGILKDKYYNKNIHRSVLITSLESYLLAKSHDIILPLGSLGENILTDFNPYYLNAGDKMKLGDIILEISQNCTMCEHLSNIDERLPELLKDDRGIFAKVINGGLLKNDEQIYLLS